jgi:large conductance mechanosensitive channel
MSWVSDFRKFIMRGSVISLAIGVVMGTAFTAIVNSLVDDIIMPLIGGLIGVDFTDLTFQLNGVTISYGNFIQALINFLIISLFIFFTIRWLIRLSTSMGQDAGDLGLEGIVPGDEKPEPEPEPEPEPSEEVALLTEIRDLMKIDAERPVVRARVVEKTGSQE